MKKYSVGIIGSGFGALSVANRLQGNGFDVTIYEKQSQPGGQAVQLKERGYKFDMGPSLITAPEIIDEIFSAANANREDYLEYIPLDPYYRIYFSDGKYLDYSGNTKAMRSEISKFDKSDADKYEKFINYSKRLYELVIEDGLGEQPFLSMKDFVRAFPNMLSTKAFLPATSVVNKYFNHPNIRFTFSFHPLFIGGNPFRAPALYLMIPYLEKMGGVWFTKGGMYSVVEALVNVFKKNGGKILFNEEVSEIVIEDKRAVGIKTKKGEKRYDLIVSNAHYGHTYGSLIKNSQENVQDKKYSMSCYLLYLGVKKKYPQLQHHTLITSPRYKTLIEDIFDKKILADDFSMYLHVPTRTDSSMAPKDSESIYVLIPTPNLSGSVDWEVENVKFTNKVIDFLEKDFGMKDLKKNIEVQKTFNPRNFESERNNYLGSAWSLEPTLFQSANFRPHNKSKKYKNLYLVGASTHPGAGVPGVMLTAKTTEKLIRKDFP